MRIPIVTPFREGRKEGKRLFRIFYGEISQVDSLSEARERALGIYAGNLPLPNSIVQSAKAPIARMQRSFFDIVFYSMGLYLNGPKTRQ